jgi:hypothetical protein
MTGEIISKELLDILPILENSSIAISETAIVARRNLSSFYTEKIRESARFNVLRRTETEEGIFYVSICFEWEGNQRDWSYIAKEPPKDFMFEHDVIYKHWRITLPLGVEYLGRFDYCFSPVELKKYDASIEKSGIICLGKIKNLYIYQSKNDD